MTVIDEMQSAGAKTVSLNALNLAAGVYYYQLTAGEFSEVKKNDFGEMILKKSFDHRRRNGLRLSIKLEAH